MLALYGRVMLRAFERKLPFSVEPAAPGSNAERVSFPTAGGLTLRGSLYRHEVRPPRGLIIFCPELGGNHWCALNYCQGLWDAGFNILAFDFRNQGESDAMGGYDPLHWSTEYEIDDAMAVIAYSRQRHDLSELPVGLFGISRGGSVALATAARCRDVRCVAGEGVFSNNSLFVHYTLRWAVLYCPEWLLKLLPLWHIKLTVALIRWISQVRRRCRYVNLERLLPRLENIPTLFIAGTRDTYVHLEIPNNLSRRIGAERSQVWVVEGAKHNLARQVDPDAYDSKLVDFFSYLDLKTADSSVSRSQV